MMDHRADPLITAKEGDAMIWPSHTSLLTLERDEFQSALTGCALRLAEECRYDAEHAHHVGRLALGVFDDLRALHGYGPDERFALHLASLLHDIGHIGGAKGHHKRSLRIILEAEALPLDHRARLLIGCIARYHRKALPKQGHPHFSSLDEPDQRRVQVLGGILRMADALDKGHACLVTQISTAATPRSIIFDCETRDIEYVHQVVLPIRKSNLLEQAFERRICCVWQER
jgi:exopolyphosphatase/pppGpp-phosphohydrolase